MRYQALYRKYRPSDFDDVIGQKNIVKTLKNSLNLNKFSHAYLFSGPRGTGKTTLAKILAKNINCLEQVNGECCGKCSNCLAILNNECSDIIEIDAASNNGVEEIREIRNNINLVPNQLKYKVYIIDEVHMLSIGAFNALLKTLEEPPSHVMFILATTDLHKVPITIVSRCQCFEFKRISDDDIVERLKYIVNEENIEIDDEVLYKIAKTSDGGMRDSLSLLDKIRSYTTDKITLEDFYEINGSLKEEVVNNFINSIVDKNILNILKISDDISSSGKDYIMFSQDILDVIRKKIVNYYVNDDKDVVDVEFLLNFANKFNKIINNLKNSSNVKIMFETSILSLVNTESINLEEKLVKNVKKIENLVKNEENIPIFQKNNENNVIKNDMIIQNNEQNNNDNDFINQYMEFRKKIINNSFVTANKEYLLKIKNDWYLINDYILDSELSPVVSYLKDIEVRVVGENEIILSCNYDSILERGINLINKIEKLLELIYNKRYKVALVTNNEWEDEKNKFILARKSGKSYEYMPYDSNDELKEKATLLKKTNSSSIVQDAIDLFGEDMVKIQ